MKIILATGIFPPDIGGPATFVAEIARELAPSHPITVVTYGKETSFFETGGYRVVTVSKQGGMFGRWSRYRRAIRKYGADADRIYVFTSVSAGIPVILSGLTKPKMILRLGGDFFWERYTDAGGMKSLREWYRSVFGFWRLINTAFMESILTSFDFIVYSTDFQRTIHQKSFRYLPASSVIPNAKPLGAKVAHSKHTPFKLLFMGRFVRFKNLDALLEALTKLPDVTLTLVGAGPIESHLRSKVAALHLESRVRFEKPVTGEAKRSMFEQHDLLVLPSVTEISPNVALEASALSLPVLLTEETGLQSVPGIRLARLRSADDIVVAIKESVSSYQSVSSESPVRTYKTVAQNFLAISL